MKFKKVNIEDIPPRDRDRHKFKEEFERFISMYTKVVKVDFSEHEYKNIHTAYNTMHHSAKRLCMPIQVTMRKNEIYLIRTDM